VHDQPTGADSEPFPRCLVQRVCDPKGPAQYGQNFRRSVRQNFRKGGRQNFRNPQVSTLDKHRHLRGSTEKHIPKANSLNGLRNLCFGVSRRGSDALLSKRAPSSASARVVFIASSGEMSRRSGFAAEADNHSDISPSLESITYANLEAPEKVIVP
jgi:hypothetical protein